jgi:GNAT superfamily N-acetyltransferase
MIREVSAPAAQAGLAELADILVDAVAHGASVNFLAGLTPHAAAQFWAGQIPGLRAGSTRLFVAEQAGQWLGTVLLFMAHQPNAPHRAEIGKMLVRSTARRRGLGRALLTAAETAALAAGRNLLLLDTETGSAGDLLYRAAGWLEYGRVPGHALRPNGEPAETTMFYKRLDTGILP